MEVWLESSKKPRLSLAARLSNSNITLAFFLLLNVIYSKKSYIHYEFMYMDQFTKK